MDDSERKDLPERKCICATTKGCKRLGLSINICTLIVGILSIVAGASYWALSFFFMIASGLFIIVTELYYLPRLMMYVKFNQTLWGRTVFFMILAFVSFMNGDALHITCMSLMLAVVLFFIIYGVVAIFLLKIPYGVPPQRNSTPQKNRHHQKKRM
eukprot:550374_1